jgi:xyloglucan 6-xylosyltransferase
VGSHGPERPGKVLTATLTGRPDFEADDQSALIYLLVTQEQWKEKVFLETSYYLHGYWVILVERYEEMMANNKPGLGDDRWPFVTHFVGCKPCGSYGDYDVNRCINQMDRAFNFADNQVLEHYGFLHRSLGTAKVKRIRNDTTDPLGVQAEIARRNQIGAAGVLGGAGAQKSHQDDMDAGTGDGSAR